MKCSVRQMMLAVLALSSLCGYRAHAGARPVIGGILSSSFFEAKTAVGNDGMLRLLFDYSPSKFPAASTYSGSALWIIDPNGSVVAAGSPTIPASVGSDIFEVALLNDVQAALVERSNTAIFAQPDGNTTVLFYYDAEHDGLSNISSFATWTYNSSGALIAAAGPYGPFTGARLGGLYFDPSGKIVARWRFGPSASSPNAGWVLDEFGTIMNATNVYGFGTTYLGKIRLTPSGAQIWPFSSKNASGQYTTTIWTFNTSGSLVNAQVYGPF